MTEVQLTRKILKALRNRGGLWFKIHGSAYQMTGLPDIIGCYRGRFVGIEVKLPDGKNKLSQRQRLILTRLSRQGGYSRVVSSKRGALRVMDDIDSDTKPID